MADIQLQVQNLVELATASNIELANIETNLLQSSKTYKKQIGDDIYSIVDELWTVIHGDMERQTYCIQKLLANELDGCKEKGNIQFNEYIWEIQEVYWDTNEELI